jgi:hypothetical protein
MRFATTDVDIDVTVDRSAAGLNRSGRIVLVSPTGPSVQSILAGII